MFLSKAIVFHKRFAPAINEFSYRVFYLCFDIAKIDKIKQKFLSLNSFNLFSFYNKDHGKRKNENLESWIREILIKENLNQQIDKIFLLSHPRLLGYVFNPVSFWFCLDKNQNLRAVLCEVNNTFKESHNYLIFNRNFSPITENQILKAQKDFHVSPFFTRQGFYEFQFKFNHQNIFAKINYFSPEKELLLTTTMSCKNAELNSRNLILAFLEIPLVTFKVIFLIHFQALKIIFKKIKYIRKPEQKTIKLTINNE
jgi:DUF1365 family protein